MCLNKIPYIPCIFITVFIVAITMSCSSNDELFEKIPYATDNALLDSVISFPEINLNLAPPRDWKAMDKDKMDLFRRMLAGTDMSEKFYPVYPLVAYMDSASGMMMYVSMIEELEAPLEDIAKKYDDFLMPRLKTSGMDRKTYIVNGIKLYHYLIHSTQIVNYKLIGETASGGRFLIEYIIATPYYADIESSIESSIATMENSAGSH